MVSFRVEVLVMYSNNPHKRTGVLGVQADFVLINWVFSVKSAGKCSSAPGCLKPD